MAEALYSCEVCGNDGLTDEELRYHMVYSHLEGNSSCPFCDLTDVSADEMILHVNSAHLDYLSPQNEEASEPFVITNGFGDHIIVDGPPTATVKNKTTPILNTNLNTCVPMITVDSDGDEEMNSNFPPNDNSKNCEGSPSRSQLSLNLNQTKLRQQLATPTKFSASSLKQNIVQCPMCNTEEQSPDSLEEHINRAHFDLSSPSIASVVPVVESETILFSCPLCLKHFETSPDLELHVNIAHKDILSPAKSTASTPSENETEIATCPVCDRSGFPSYTELALHIDTHFSRKPSIVSPEERIKENFLTSNIEKQEKEVQKMREQQEFSQLRAQYGMDNEGNFSQQSISNMQRAVYSGELSVADYYERKIELKVAEQNGVDDGRSCTKGLLQPIQAVCESSNNVKAVWLCSNVDHYASTYGDRGWGCGYRNIQMILSCLQHHTGYYGRLFSAPDRMPSISQLQKLIEKAWRSGFDLQGCEQLGGKLTNTRKWIGATEVTTLLSSFKIRCELLECHRPTGPNGTHPDLFRWCLDYFSKPSDFKPPIYLQHQGHSRTIIGVEELNTGSRLLMLDPSHSPTQMSRLTYGQSSTSAMRLVRKSLNSMKAKQYQMVVVVGLIETEQEFRQSKVLQSIRLPKE